MRLVFEFLLNFCWIIMIEVGIILDKLCLYEEKWAQILSREGCEKF